VSALPPNLALHTNIVTTLKKYREIEIDFLAKVLGVKSDDLRESIETLEGEGVIRREGDRISLERV